MIEILKRSLDFVTHVKEQGSTAESLRARQQLATDLVAAMDQAEPQPELQGLPQALSVPSPAEGGNAFLWFQTRELERAREKHTAPITSVHAAYGIIKEELEEFWDEVKRQERNRAKMAEELIQVAAMCQRAFEELGLWRDFRPS